MLQRKKSPRKGFKTAKTTSKRVGTYIPKPRGVRGVRKPRNLDQLPEMHVDAYGEEEEMDYDDSENDDYVGKDDSSEDEGDDLELENEFEDEEVDVLEEKEFEDYLNGG